MKKLSRSKLELFLECPRCFWLDQVKGVKRPPPAPYTINSAIDHLLKQEFDSYREKGEPHPIMTKHGVEAIPFAHPQLDKWRHNFTGVSHLHTPTGIHIYGAVDDIWVNPNGEVMVVDYKATGANQHQIYDSYGRQMEVYQWLLRRNDLEVSPTGYFVFARVNKGNGFASPSDLAAEASAEKAAMKRNGKTGLLPFDIFVESHTGDDAWVEETIIGAAKLLEQTKAPVAAGDCEYCKYREAGHIEDLPKESAVPMVKKILIPAKKSRVSNLGI